MPFPACREGFTAPFRAVSASRVCSCAAVPTEVEVAVPAWPFTAWPAFSPSPFPSAFPVFSPLPASPEAPLPSILSPAVSCRICSSRCSALSSATSASAASRLSPSSRFRSAVIFRSSLFFSSGSLSSSSSAACSMVFRPSCRVLFSAFRAAASASCAFGISSSVPSRTAQPSAASSVFFALPGRICFTSSPSSALQASCRCSCRIGSSPPSRAVTVRSFRPQASAACAAVISFTGRAAFPSAVSSMTAAAAAAAHRPRSGTGTKNETACRITAAASPAASPAAAPRKNLFRRIRCFTGLSAFSTSFIKLLTIYALLFVLCPLRIISDARPIRIAAITSIPAAEASEIKIQPARSAMRQVHRIRPQPRYSV